MTEWIKEFNIKLLCNLSSLDFYCNNRSNIIEIHLSPNDCNIRLFSSNYRLSFSNDRLFDFNNLSVKKGDEARTEILNLIKPIKENISEDLESTKLKYDIPSKIIEDFVYNFNANKIDLRKFLDFDVNYIEYDFGKDFIKNDPKFATEKRFKLVLGIKNRYIKIINWVETKKIDILLSDNNEAWTENISDVKDIIANFHTLDQRYIDIKKYIENLINTS
ncbi:hypothetical protein DFR86_02220 [Acidianus sulfidivorans JP7]|uniref:Uncharacterized protein n=1 Tax=Acidianus sulfidivorans JP7 TaxID=619593 RepID=A0A2U9IKA6_9CREN|nr:hypothetical protein [Acidianus sulfidivorans]AWR96482.1 hypothetical protein DFR86_02220 [Acidianus sulfidivorans JP7]